MREWNRNGFGGGDSLIENKNTIKMFKFLQLEIEVKFKYVVLLTEDYQITISCLLEDIDPMLPNFHFMLFDRY